MGDNKEADEHRHAVIGNKDNFWLYDSRSGFDLTRPSAADSPHITPRITIQTTTSPITIDPAKTALIVIDMQNFFLSSAIGRPRGAGHNAVEQLVQLAVPAARTAGIRVVWLNWGLTEEDLRGLPPAMMRSFGFEGYQGDKAVAIDKNGNVSHESGTEVLRPGQKRLYKGPGSDMGKIIDPETGEERNGGRFLMRDQWNSALFPPLDKLYEEGQRVAKPPDVWMHKNRMSGMWSSSTPLAKFLAQEGLRTLMFTGVNTDQCVGGTLTDCFNERYFEMSCLVCGVL